MKLTTHIFETLSIPCLIVSEDMTISFVSSSQASILGYKKDELEGQSFIILVPEKDRADLMDYAVQCFSDPSCFEAESIRFWNLLGKDGHEIPLKTRAISFLDLEKKKYRLTISEIMANPKFDEEMWQKQRLEALGRLAGGVAHEMNNLMQPALIFSEFVLSRVDAGDTDTKLAMNTVIESLERARDIVQDILVFTRNEKIQNERLSISKTAQSSLHFLKGLIPNTVELEMIGFDDIETREGENRTDIALIDRNAMTQVFTNLINNAVYAMEGRGKITVSFKKIDINQTKAKILDVEKGEYGMLTFTDTGCGMAPDVLKRLFEPFFTTKGVGEGTGLGMSVVYGIVTGWGGAVDVKSQPGKGTEFFFYIPLQKD